MEDKKAKISLIYDYFFFNSDRKYYLNCKTIYQILYYISIIKLSEISLRIFQIKKGRKFFAKIHCIVQRCSMFTAKGKK
jgi:hypothetical protein